MKNILKFLFRKKEKVVIRNITHSKLTLDEWRRTSTLVTESIKLSENPVFRAMIDVLKTESPVNYVSLKEGTVATADILELGKIRGYHHALNILEQFCVPSDEPSNLEATFAPEFEKEPKA